ncbi:hypothetical protein L195_g046264, partial [Trifolium pratense]
MRMVVAVAVAVMEEDGGHWHCSRSAARLTVMVVVLTGGDSVMEGGRT